MEDQDCNEFSITQPKTGIKMGLCEDLDMIFSGNSLHE